MFKIKLLIFNMFDRYQQAEIYEEQTKILREPWYFKYVNWVYIHLIKKFTETFNSENCLV